jgi:S1-C subfamily serine protease
LSDLVRAAAPGDVVALEIVRDGETESVEVTLGTSTRGDAVGRGGHGFDLPTDALSAVERLLDADVEETDAGFEVTAVSERRNRFGLAVGDVVSMINGQNATELDTAALIAELESADDPELTIVITRDGEEVTLTGEFFGGRGGRGFGGGHLGGRRDSDDLVPTEEAPAEVTPEGSLT